MRFSVVIPTYNGERYLFDTLISACNQTRAADEIAVIDDGSNDSTLDICRKAVFKNRIVVYENREGPSGFVKAWINAIARAREEYVTLLHQDDLLHESFLSCVENALYKYPHVKHIYTACNYIDAHGRITRTPLATTSGEPVLMSGTEYRKKYLRSVEAEAHIHRCPGVVTHKEVFEKCNYRPEAGHIADDDLFYRVGRYTDVVGIDVPLAYYRNHSQSATGQLGKGALTRTLARDYTYQSCYHANEHDFDEEDMVILHRLATRAITSLFYYGVAENNTSYIRTALECRETMVHLRDDEFFRHVKWHHTMMWLLWKYGYHRMVSSCVRIIGYMRCAKRLLKG